MCAIPTTQRLNRFVCIASFHQTETYPNLHIVIPPQRRCVKRHVVLDELQHLRAGALVRALHRALAIQLGQIRLDCLQALRPLQRQPQRLLGRRRSHPMRMGNRFGRVVDVALAAAATSATCVTVEVQTLDAAHVRSGFVPMVMLTVRCWCGGRRCGRGVETIFSPPMLGMTVPKSKIYY